jgi:hypothetical protein
LKAHGDSGIVGGQTAESVSFWNKRLSLPEMLSGKARLFIDSHLPLAEPNVQHCRPMGRGIRRQFRLPGPDLTDRNNMGQPSHFIEQRFRRNSRLGPRDGSGLCQLPCRSRMERGRSYLEKRRRNLEKCGVWKRVRSGFALFRRCRQSGPRSGKRPKTAGSKHQCEVTQPQRPPGSREAGKPGSREAGICKRA